MEDLYLMACKKYIAFLSVRIGHNQESYQKSLQCIRSHLFDDEYGGRETINLRKNLIKGNEGARNRVDYHRKELKNIFPKEEYVYEIASNSVAICFWFLTIIDTITNYQPQKINGYFYSRLPSDNPRLLGLNVDLWEKANYAYETSTSYLKEFFTIDPNSNCSLEQLSEYVKTMSEILHDLSQETFKNLDYYDNY